MFVCIIFLIISILLLILPPIYCQFQPVSGGAADIDFAEGNNQRHNRHCATTIYNNDDPELDRLVANIEGKSRASLRSERSRLIAHQQMLNTQTNKTNDALKPRSAAESVLRHNNMTKEEKIVSNTRPDPTLLGSTFDHTTHVPVTDEAQNEHEGHNRHRATTICNDYDAELDRLIGYIEGVHASSPNKAAGTTASEGKSTRKSRSRRAKKAQKLSSETNTGAICANEGADRDEKRCLMEQNAILESTMEQKETLLDEEVHTKAASEALPGTENKPTATLQLTSAYELKAFTARIYSPAQLDLLKIIKQLDAVLICQH